MPATELGRYIKRYLDLRHLCKALDYEFLSFVFSFEGVLLDFLVFA